MFGARFDLVFKSIKEGSFLPPKHPAEAERIVSKYEGHGEL
jgi:hypothetical protein